MIDLHCHILPNADDGAAALDDSLAMARAAYADGVRAVVATPHESSWQERHPGPGGVAALQEAVRRLEEATQRAGIPLAFYAGMEAEFDLDLPRRLAAGRVLPLGEGRCFLLELPFYQYSLHLERAIFEVQLQGWKPVLAHVERCLYVQEAPDILLPLVQRGVAVQVTAGSLCGAAGPRAKETAQRLLRRGLVHVLASDGHAAEGERCPLLTPGVEVAARIVGLARAQAMVTEVPQRILEGSWEPEGASLPAG